VALPQGAPDGSSAPEATNADGIAGSMSRGAHLFRREHRALSRTSAARAEGIAGHSCRRRWGGTVPARAFKPALSGVGAESLLARCPARDRASRFDFSAAAINCSDLDTAELRQLLNELGKVVCLFFSTALRHNPTCREERRSSRHPSRPIPRPSSRPSPDCCPRKPQYMRPQPSSAR
jgi:hypothetical protein